METKNRKEMRDIVARFQEYVATYSNQDFFEIYPINTFIEDMIYGVGIAVEPEKFRGSDGYERFREYLKKVYERYE
jgi:hypothetical protein